ncbi:MAG: hypothetical protein ACRDPC_23910 [Solirubrobacteraceae bacterium]
MTIYAVARRAYHPGMDDGLPHPAEFLTLAEIQDQQARVFALLERGGVIVVLGDDGSQMGVLTRQRPLLDEASIAAQIENGTLPPIAELFAMDDGGELP